MLRNTQEFVQYYLQNYLSSKENTYEEDDKQEEIKSICADSECIFCEKKEIEFAENVHPDKESQDFFNIQIENITLQNAREVFANLIHLTKEESATLIQNDKLFQYFFKILQKLVENQISINAIAEFLFYSSRISFHLLAAKSTDEVAFEYVEFLFVLKRNSFITNDDFIRTHHLINSNFFELLADNFLCTKSFKHYLNFIHENFSQNYFDMIEKQLTKQNKNFNIGMIIGSGQSIEKIEMFLSFLKTIYKNNFKNKISCELVISCLQTVATNQDEEIFLQLTKSITAKKDYSYLSNLWQPVEDSLESVIKKALPQFTHCPAMDVEQLHQHLAVGLEKLDTQPLFAQEGAAFRYV